MRHIWQQYMRMLYNLLIILVIELDGICTNIPELYVVSGTLNSEPSILNRPLGNQ